MTIIKGDIDCDYFGIDVNSKFEKSPGVKDMALILQLKQGLKK